MVREPLRFVHAANLLLDASLAETGPLAPAHRELIEEASFQAFDRIVATCIDRHVDLLLLAGNSFDERDGSVRALAAIREGCARLNEHRIPVCIVTGVRDPDEAWPDLELWPDNVLLLPDDDEPCLIERDENTLAVIRRVTGTEKNASKRQRATAVRREPFTIGVVTSINGRELDDLGALQPQSLLPDSFADCAVDYLALGGLLNRSTVTLANCIAHHPGSAQGLGPGDIGPRGCTLVEVDHAGRTECKFIPAGGARYETIKLHVNTQTTSAQLQQEMRQALAQCRSEPSERLWLIRWLIDGVGPVLGVLEQDASRNELLAAVTLGPDGPQLVHSVRILTSTEPARETLRDTRFGDQCLDLLEGDEPPTPDTLRQILGDHNFPETEWSHRLLEIAQELDCDAIAGRSRRLATALFGAK